jgi:hypothetical protein
MYVFIIALQHCDKCVWSGLVLLKTQGELRGLCGGGALDFPGVKLLWKLCWAFASAHSLRTINA